jgi:hypothetical protein
MVRSIAVAGFGARAEPVTCPRLIDAVAASFAMASLSICLIIALAVISVRIGMAMGIPA